MLHARIPTFLAYLLLILMAVGAIGVIVRSLETALPTASPALSITDEINEEDDIEGSVPEVDGRVEATAVPSGWTLVAGELSDTCTAPTFSGEARIRGWLVYTETLGSPEWLFQIADSDQAKLPLHTFTQSGLIRTDVNRLAFLDRIPESLVTPIRSATPEKPVTITVRGYRLYCEEHPSLSFDIPTDDPLSE